MVIRLGSVYSFLCKTSKLFSYITLSALISDISVQLTQSCLAWILPVMAFSTKKAQADLPHSAANATRAACGGDSSLTTH